MCAYSMVVDAGRALPFDRWTNSTWSQFQQILEEIKKLDEKMGQKDCEDPSKQAWMREVEARLKKLEEK